MTIRKVWGSRVDKASATSFIGQKGTIFFEEPGVGETTGIRISDGITPGGVSLSISAATTSTIGGIRPGPGVVISNTGLLTIDSAGLPISFGDFYADDNNISTINANQDFNIMSNGTGSVNVVGKFNLYTSEDGVNSTPIFSINTSGQTLIICPALDGNQGAVTIIGSASGEEQTPVNTGVMLHVTGNNNDSSRIYNDAIGGYAGFVGRRFNGFAIAPTKILANEEITRFVGNAYTGGGWKPTGSARISIIANENQESNAQGGRVELWACPNGANTQTLVTKFDVLNGISATTATISNLNINANGMISTPAITFNDGGIRQIGSTSTVTIDFSKDSIVTFTQSNNSTISLSNPTAGRTVKVIMMVGTVSYTLGLGISSVQNSTNGVTEIPAGGSSGISPNQCVILEYTCVAGTTASTYVSVVYR